MSTRQDSNPCLSPLAEERLYFCNYTLNREKPRKGKMTFNLKSFSAGITINLVGKGALRLK